MGEGAAAGIVWSLLWLVCSGPGPGLQASAQIFLSCLSRSSFFYYFHIELEALLHKCNFLQHLLILDSEI